MDGNHAQNELQGTYRTRQEDNGAGDSRQNKTVDYNQEAVDMMVMLVYPREASCYMSCSRMLNMGTSSIELRVGRGRMETRPC
eukprot:1124608-Karenia_brevis.AAC.2